MSKTFPMPKAIAHENITAKNLAALTAALAAGDMLATPKRDGCAVVFKMVGGEMSVLSGSGKPVLSLPHAAGIIEARLKERGVRDAVVCAEAYLPGEPFQVVSGVFRRHTPQLMHLMIYDGMLGTGDSVPWLTRLQALEEYLTTPYISVAPVMTPIRSYVQAEEMAREQVLLGGYDGLVLHHRSKAFVPGRSKFDTVKVKPLKEYDLLVTGFVAKVGEKTGRPTVALQCRWADGKVQEVASGLNHAEQANPERFVGRIIMVRGMGLTADGMLREPVYCGLREDKDTGDF